MIRFYRGLALILIGLGSWWMYFDYPPKGALSSWQFEIGLYGAFLPGVVNLLNALLGRRASFLRWVVVVMNAVVVAVWISILMEVGFETRWLLASVAFMVLAVASFLMARSWSEEAKTAR